MGYKFAKIPPKDIANFWRYRLARDAINKAITRAKQLGLTTADMQPLMVKKLQNNQLFIEAEKTLVYNAINSNLIDFGNDWYGIVCMGANKKNKYDLVVAPFKNLDFNKIYIDIGNDKNKPRTAFSNFLDNNVNYSVLDIYQMESSKQANELLNQCFQYTVNIEKDKKTYHLSVHCINRWNERIEQVNSKLTLQQREDIVRKMSNIFVKSKCVYKCTFNNTKFFLNLEHMIFFAVTNDDTIVTVWKNSYGFSDFNIDRQITLLQLDYLTRLKKTIPNVVKGIETDIAFQSNIKNQKMIEKNQLNNLFQQYEHQMLELQQKCEALKMQEQQLDESINNVDCTINALVKRKNECYKNLQNEEAKIFKAHKMIDVGTEESE